jgi:CheY-like chemotaxis protein
MMDLLGVSEPDVSGASANVGLTLKSLPRIAPRRARILVIDDEPAIGICIKRALRGDHDVECSSSPREDLEKLVAGNPYDVILCDLMMPGMTGIQLHKALVQRAPDVARRVVFVTGGVFTPEAAEFLARNGVARLNKPFELPDLRQMISQVLEREGRTSDPQRPR